MALATFQNQSLHRVYTTLCQAHYSKPGTSCFYDRRQFIIWTSGVAATSAAGQLTAKAEDIGFFGIRKKAKGAEKEAEKIVEKGPEEKKGVETVQEEVGSSGSFGALVQAGVVAGLEVLGVFVAASLVKGILESDA